MAKKYRILLWLAAVILLLSGCEKLSPAHYFSYRAESFRAELRGTLHGQIFCAVIAVEKDADDIHAEIAFLEPSSDEKSNMLANLTLKSELLSDGTLRGKTEIFYHGIETEAESTTVEAFWLPVSVLFAYSELQAVQKENQTLCLTFAEGTVLTLDEQMLPHTFHSPSVSFDVIWWETLHGPK